MSTVIDRLDGLSSTTAYKGPCRLAAPVHVNPNGLKVVDGVQTVAGDRVILANQNDYRDNGIWIVDTGNWRRAADFNKTGDIARGTRIATTEGNSGPAELQVSGPVLKPRLGVDPVTFDLSAGSSNAAALSQAVRDAGDILVATGEAGEQAVSDINAAKASALLSLLGLIGDAEDAAALARAFAGDLISNGQVPTRTSIASAKGLPVNAGINRLRIFDENSDFAFSATEPVGGVLDRTKFQTSDGKWWSLIPGFLRQDQKKIRIVSGVIRQLSPGAGWFFITDAGHDPLPSPTVSVNASGNLVVSFGFTAKKVIYLAATPDEFFAKQGMVLGASVGTSSTEIEGAGELSAAITSGGVAFTGSLGFAQDVSVVHSAADGTVAFTHKATYAFGNSRGQGISCQLANTTGIASGAVMLSGVSASGFTVNRTTPLSGVVSMSNGTPVLTTLCAGVSVAWDATNTCFVITHPTVSSNDRTPVIGGMIRTPASDTPYVYLAEFTSSTTETRVHVYNAITGAKITTTADNSMRFSFVRPNTQTLRPIASGQDIIVRRANVPLNFTNVFGTTGNIWIYGIFEID